MRLAVGQRTPRGDMPVRILVLLCRFQSLTSHHLSIARKRIRRLRCARLSARVRRFGRSRVARSSPGGHLKPAEECARAC